MSGGGARRVLEAWKLGVVKYDDTLRLQERLIADRRAGRVPDLVLSLQHPPTYTLGKRRTDHNLQVPEADLRGLGAELHRTERGGDVTFHGLRQAMLYPILSLRAFNIDPDEVIHDQLVHSLARTFNFSGVEVKDDSECADMICSAAATQS